MDELICWKRENDRTYTIETLRISKTGSGYFVKSIVNGILVNKPILLEYQILIDESWRVTSVRIESMFNKTENLVFKSTSEGKWHDSANRERAELNGCIDIDLSITPFTNTLPIRRLESVLDKRTKISVLYFDLSNWTFKKVEQFYTRIDSNLYKYEGVFRDFVADLPIDNSGFVTTYPGLFERLYPKA